MELVSPLDAAWLWIESSAGLTHVTGVQIFEPPAEPATDDLIDRIHAEVTDATRLKAEFRLRVTRSWRTGGQYAWEIAPLDLVDHVHRARLPAPGGRRELHDVVGRFHTEPLDRTRPLWQAQLVEGLDGGGFALITKVHHALFDGVAASKHLMRGLATEPDGEGTAPWLEPRRPARRRPSSASRTAGDAHRWSLRDLVTAPATLSMSGLRSATAFAAAGVSVLTAGAAFPFAAPPTTFNGEVGPERTVAAASATLERVRRIAVAAGVSTNDAILAVCAGGLRRHLLRSGGLPSAELTALVPVSRRDGRDSVRVRGNAITSVICGLATDEPDPRARLLRIHAGMQRNKALATALDPVSAAGLMAFTMGGAVAGSVPGLPLPPRPPFNLTVSTVPGSADSLYWHGCRLVETYPASIVTRGQGLNLTLVTYGGRIAVGVTACRGSGVVADDLVLDLEDSLYELAAAFDAALPPSDMPIAPARPLDVEATASDRDHQPVP